MLILITPPVDFLHEIKILQHESNEIACECRFVYRVLDIKLFNQ